jgi:hypothetical protein
LKYNLIFHFVKSPTLIYSNPYLVKKYSDPTNIITPINDAVNSVYSFLSAKPPGARPKISSEPAKTMPASTSINGEFDRRVRLKVPEFYVTSNDESSSFNPAVGPNAELAPGVGSQGIVFPFTPQISQDFKASYAAVNAMHSNYTQYFYKNSTVGEITLVAKFISQTEQDAAVYLAIMHLLRALIKMKFGNEANAGSPPPICRLHAHGKYMLDNVPVVVGGFRVDLPSDVDYFTTGEKLGALYGQSSVPTFSTLNLTLIPIYSRAEQLAGTVEGWLREQSRSKGYL